jgi:hypothetical protein
MRQVTMRSVPWLALAAMLASPACSSGGKGEPAVPGGTGGSGGMGGTGGGAPPPLPFEPLPAPAALSKVKGILTGLPPSAEELQAVQADPAALAGLIDRWTMTEEFRGRMLSFFQQAFQQTQTDVGDYVDLLGKAPTASVHGKLLVRAIEESFARTVLALIAAGRPFTEAVTTDTFMLNPPLMELLAELDAVPRDDELKIIRKEVWPLAKFPGFKLVRTSNLDPATGMPRPIPFAETIDPQSPNFGVFYDPNPVTNDKPACQDPQTVMGANAFVEFSELLWGSRPGACGNTTPQFTVDDFAAWRMVRIRPPAAGEERTLFWDLPHLRDPATSELVLATPRVGFLTTLAFFANWPTNASNASRVTTNQALIVGLGRSFDDRGTTVQVSETSVDMLHVQPGTVCFGCHQTLDPMRDFFRQSYNIGYFQQLVPANSPPTATFTVDGSAPVTGKGIAVFARAIAEHPRFAVGWAQKVCQLANSDACDAEDPELLRVAAVFRDSHFDFRVLVREMFSSPLVTFRSKTKTADAPVISIARREGLCALLDNRLGLSDVCELEPAKRTRTSHNLAMAIPGGAYSRGEEAPLLPHDPNLFFSSATENLCFQLAPRLVDAAGGTSRWSSARAEQAVGDFVHLLMGLPPGHPREPALLQILADHRTAALAAGASATTALRSTFLAACTSPFTLSHGL